MLKQKTGKRFPEFWGKSTLVVSSDVSVNHVNIKSTNPSLGQSNFVSEDNIMNRVVNCRNNS